MRGRRTSPIDILKQPDKDDNKLREELQLNNTKKARIVAAGSDHAPVVDLAVEAPSEQAVGLAAFFSSESLDHVEALHGRSGFGSQVHDDVSEAALPDGVRLLAVELALGCGFPGSDRLVRQGCRLNLLLHYFPEPN